MLINPQVVFTASCFALSEVLPYLPGKSNNLVHLAVTGLNMAKLIPDDVYNKFEASTLDQSTKPNNELNENQVALTIPKGKKNVKIVVHIEFDE